MISMIENKTGEEGSAGWKKYKRSTIRLFFSHSIITILFVSSRLLKRTTNAYSQYSFLFFFPISI